MTYYLLPRTTLFLYKHINYFQSDDEPTCIISNSLSGYLSDIKHKISEREKEWDIYKKYTNPYEYIHTVVPNKKKSISKHKPLSRSYFKMVEIIQTFNIQFPQGIKTFHLAEGPGGFIEALLHIRQCKKDKYVGMTILDNKHDSNIPAWKKSQSFLKENPNVYIEEGADKTGNILSIENFEHCVNKYGSTMDFITADGGFDFSIDFNKQEISIAKLLFAQICFAVSMQKKGGMFVLKIFDCFMQHTVDLIYILSSFYEKVYIIKPNTSRYANSEKYIICRGFIFESNQYFYPYLYGAFAKMSVTDDNTETAPYRFLDIPISYCFMTKLEEYNAIFGQQQIENIHYTISLIDNKNKQDKIDTLIKTNVLKSIQWCIKHNLNYFSNMAMPDVQPDIFIGKINGRGMGLSQSPPIARGIFDSL